MVMLKQLKGLTTAVQSAVLGTQISREYDIGRQVASGGPGCMWKIYSAVRKSNGQAASVFMFDKKVVERLEKRDRELVYETLRRDPMQLAKLRHPRILELHQPLEETPTEMVFVTEPIFASLGNLLGRHENLSPLPLAIKEYDLGDLDRQIGFLQLVTGLEFCHKSAKLLHGNLTPESIYIDPKGDWKLGGFNFSVHLAYAGKDSMAAFSEYDDRQPTNTQPNLNYMAPERVLEPGKPLDISADIFSLGVLLHAAWAHGKPVQQSNSNLLTYKQNLSSLDRADLGALPQELRPFVRRMLAKDPMDRPTAEEILTHEYFNNVVVLTLGFLQTLVEKDDLQKAEFLKGLPRLLPQIPRRTQLSKVLTHLLDELVNPMQAPFILPNVFAISENMNNSEFRDLVLPSLVKHKVFSMKEPPQVLYLLMQKMDFLLEKTPSDVLNNHVMPMVYHSLETRSYQLQELTLSVLPNFVEAMDYSVFKNSVFPRICSLCLETDSLSVRVKSLVCMSKLFNVLDKWTAVERLIPTLQEIPSREPGVLMAICGVFHEMVKSKKLAIDKETIAIKIIPFMSPLSIDSNLNATQFKTFINVMHQMLAAIEQQQGAKLNQIDQMEKTGPQMQKDDPSKLVSVAEPDDDRMAELLGKKRQNGPMAGAASKPVAQSNPPTRNPSTSSGPSRSASIASGQSSNPAAAAAVAAMSAANSTISPTPMNQSNARPQMGAKPLNPSSPQTTAGVLSPTAPGQTQPGPRAARPARPQSSGQVGGPARGPMTLPRPVTPNQMMYGGGGAAAGLGGMGATGGSGWSTNTMGTANTGGDGGGWSSGMSGGISTSQGSGYGGGSSATGGGAAGGGGWSSGISGGGGMMMGGAGYGMGGAGAGGAAGTGGNASGWSSGMSGGGVGLGMGMSGAAGGNTWSGGIGGAGMGGYGGGMGGMGASQSQGMGGIGGMGGMGGAGMGVGAGTGGGLLQPQTMGGGGPGKKTNTSRNENDDFLL